jgi:citrate lyase subunit beta / citryl-CoA lyase
MPKRHVRRSGLTMPVNNPRFLNAVWTRGCDFVNLDLEDSVPESQKPFARSLIRSAIPTAAKGGAEVFVRINHDYVEADLEGVIWPGLSRVNYPKAETAEEIRKLDVIITRLERERGIRPGTVEIGANIETARGVANAHEIASASSRVRDFGGGGGYDMSRDLGVEMFVGFDQFLYGKGELELVARALGLKIHRAAPFVANTTGSVSDADRAFREAEAARKCGFREGGGLHPNVIGPQNRGFTPTEAEVAEARQVIERYKAMQRAGKVWEESDGRIIDVYEARRAEELLEWAQLCADRNAEKAECVARTKAAEQG